MDKEKKKELAEMDKRWNFEKTIEVPTAHKELGWEKVRQTFNMIQEDQGDLYMEVSKLEQPEGLDRLRMWYRQRKTSGESVIFHHRQVFEWFRGLGFRLGCSTGEAVYKVLHEREELRDRLGLGDTVSVEVSSVSEMDTAKESEVTKSELKEMIDE